MVNIDKPTKKSCLYKWIIYSTKHTKQAKPKKQIGRLIFIAATWWRVGKLLFYITIPWGKGIDKKYIGEGLNRMVISGHENWMLKK